MKDEDGLVRDNTEERLIKTLDSIANGLNLALLFIAMQCALVLVLVLVVANLDYR